MPTPVVSEPACPAPVPDRRALITRVGRSLSPSRASRPEFIATVMVDRGPRTRGGGQRRGNPRGPGGRPLGATTYASGAPRRRHTPPPRVHPPPPPGTRALLTRPAGPVPADEKRHTTS